ncbi:MAG: CoA ester lyase [Thermoflexales bacterium]|nr:CoA ester lyase [Thermoflexales bacterium]
MVDERRQPHTDAVLRRSLLFVPGDSRRKLEKATTLPADSIALDLEDAVAPEHKVTARQTVREALQTLHFGKRERLVRLNAWRTGLLAEDVRETLPARPDGYIIPKVSSADELAAAWGVIREYAQGVGIDLSEIAVLVLIETARGVLNLPAIAAFGSPLQALIFGADDLAADVGMIRTPSNLEVLYPRAAVALTAAAYGLQAIDLVFPRLDDPEALAAECQFGRQLGYTGKMVIHPSQIEIVNRAFSPSDEEIAQALRIVQAAAAHPAGAFALDGRMVDEPIVKQAQGVLARARAAGLLTESA